MLKGLLIFIVIMFLIIRFVLPYYLKSFMNRMNDKMSGFTDQHKRQTDTRTEGEVVLERREKDSTQQSQSSEGDYVDFEEID